MNRAMKVGALAAGIGFFVMVCILTFKVRSPLIVNALWPTHFMAKTSKGSLWMLTFGTIGFFANAFLYGVIGYAIGRLMYGNEPKQQQRP
ncbi:MAG TPA: hypothetical protein VGM11_08755 [Acidobacteriaceae bacterium]|jgi:hypothetical protein